MSETTKRKSPRDIQREDDAVNELYNAIRSAHDVSERVFDDLPPVMRSIAGGLHILLKDAGDSLATYVDVSMREADGEE